MKTVPIRLIHTQASRSKDFISSMALGRNLCDLLAVRVLGQLSEKVRAWRGGLEGCWSPCGALPNHGRGPDRRDW